jgi:hypothetical protein
LLFASLAIICGYQAILFGVFAQTFAMAEHLIPEDPAMMRWFKLINLERGLLASGVAMLAGMALLIAAVMQWRAVDYGPLDYGHTMRYVIPGATLTALGFQTFLSSFFISILGMTRADQSTMDPIPTSTPTPTTTNRRSGRGWPYRAKGREYFAHGRLAFLRDCLADRGPAPASKPSRVMDFGCGTGTSVPIIKELLGAETIVGVDESARSIEHAAANHAAPGIAFSIGEGFMPEANFDLVYTSGVFHHVPCRNVPPPSPSCATCSDRGACSPSGRTTPGACPRAT